MKLRWWWPGKPVATQAFKIDDPEWVRWFFHDASTPRLQLVHDAVVDILRERQEEA